MGLKKTLAATALISTLSLGSTMANAAPSLPTAPQAGAIQESGSVKVPMQLSSFEQQGMVIIEKKLKLTDSINGFLIKSPER